MTPAGNRDWWWLRAALILPLAAMLPGQSKSAGDLGPATVLVASRDLEDPNFAKSVILLVHFDDDSVVGLIVNRRADVPLSRALEGMKGVEERKDSIYLGGPVETESVLAVVKSATAPEGAVHAFGDVYMISTKTLLEKTMASRPDPGVFRVYLGYAGWTGPQLRREVEMGAWFIFRADAGTVFDGDPDSLWSRMIRRTEEKVADGLLNSRYDCRIPPLRDGVIPPGVSQGIR